MKEPPTIDAGFGVLSRRFAGAVLAAATVALSAGDPPAPDKTPTLFMGADISVELGQKLYPLRRVTGGSWVVERGGTPETVDARHGLQNIKIVPALKVALASATLGNFKTEKAYSFANDPVTLQTRAFAFAVDLNAGYSAASAQASAALVQAQKMASYNNNLSGLGSQAILKIPGMIPQSAAPVGPQYDHDDVAVDNDAAASYSTNTSSGTDDELYGDHGQSAKRDALRVSFAISSRRPIRDPYIVTIARFRERNGVAGKVRSLVYARPLGPIDANPQTVAFTEEGFAPGFEILEFQAHLYSGGKEIATNLSSNRVELTRDEAFDYLVIQYLALHRNETRPAESAPEAFPVELPARATHGKYLPAYFVRVSKDGNALGVYADGACTRKAGDDAVESVVKGLRFMPALDRGKAVAGVAELRPDLHVAP